MLEPNQVLAAMITPAVLISAAALLLLSTANRLGRVNDRLQGVMAKARRVGRKSDSAQAQSQRRIALVNQLSSLVERLLLLRSAVAGMYCTIGLLVVTSIAAGMYVVFPNGFRLVSACAGLLGSVAFLYSIVVFTREAFMAVRATQEEIAATWDVLGQKRGGDGQGSSRLGRGTMQTFVRKPKPDRAAVTLDPATRNGLTDSSQEKGG